MKLYFSILLSLILISITPAYSADLSDDKKDELRSILVQAMNNLGRTDSKNNEINITRSDTYFSAVIPSVSINNKGETITKIGEIAVNAIPLDNDNEWKLSFTLPETITTYDVSGIPAMITTLGKQKASVIFNNKYKVFSKINISYDEVNIDAPKTQRVVDISNVSIIKNWEKDKGEYLSGPYTYTLTNSKLKSLGKQNFHANKIILQSNIKNYNIEKSKDYSHSKSLVNSSVYSIWDNIIREYIDNSDEILLDVQVRDITLTSQSYAEEAHENNISSVVLGLNIKDLREKLSSIGFFIKHSSDPNPSLTSSVSTFIPYKTDIDLTLKNIDKDDIFNILLDPKLEDRNDQNNSMRTRVTRNLLPALTKSSSSIDVKSFLIDSYNYGVDLKGMVNVDDSAKYKSTASISATLRGLDLILGILSGSSGIPQAYTQQLNKITTPLTMLKLVGKQRGSEDIRDYDIDINKIGTIILNGTNISSLTGNQGYTPIPNSSGEVSKPSPY